MQEVGYRKSGIELNIKGFGDQPTHSFDSEEILIS